MVKGWVHAGRLSSMLSGGLAKAAVDHAPGIPAHEITASYKEAPSANVSPVEFNMELKNPKTGVGLESPLGGSLLGPMLG